MTEIWILAITFIVCLIIGVPIAFSIGIATLAGLLAGGAPYFLLAQGAFTSFDSFTTMAVPFFILAGAIMETGGLSRRLINFAQSIVGHITGGFGIVTVLACAFFAAISGSSPATVAAIGSIMVPAMMKRGYSRGYAAALSSTAGGLGVVIPPSIPMILYAITANVSIGDIFLAGIGPGILIVTMLSVLVYFLSKKKGYLGDNSFSIKNVVTSFWNAKWALLAPVIILGGIYSGLFTPTESAVVAVVYGLIVGLFLYKELRWKDIPRILVNSATMSGAVMIVLGTALTFGRVLSMYQVPQMLSEWFTSVFSNPTAIMLMIVLLLIVVGTFMETISLMLILTPLLLPIVTSLGVDPIHFGIIMVIGAEIGLITPPVGLNLFVASGISGLSMGSISKASIPFLLTMILAFVTIVLVPQISTSLLLLLK